MAIKNLSTIIIMFDDSFSGRCRAGTETSHGTNKSNTECGIIRPTNAFTWDHIHYLEAINIL